MYLRSTDVMRKKTNIVNDALYAELAQFLVDTFECEVQSKLNGKEAIFSHIFPIVCYRTKTGRAKRWLADFWLKKHNIVVEVNGGSRINGRHNRADGYMDDLRKMNTAIANGALIFQFTYEQLAKKEYMFLVPLAIGLKLQEKQLFCNKLNEQLKTKK